MSPRIFPVQPNIHRSDKDSAMINPRTVSAHASARASPLQHPTIVHVNGNNNLVDDNATEMDVDVDVDEGDEYTDSSAETVEVDELDESDHEEPQAQWQRAPPGGNAERVTSGVGRAAAAPSVAPTKATPAVKKPRPKPPATRLPGQTIVPMSRVEAIAEAEGTSLHSLSA